MTLLWDADGLRNHQIGTLTFCGTGAATMVHYGGRHSWDITEQQAQEAAYVRVLHRGKREKQADTKQAD